MVPTRDEMDARVMERWETESPEKWICMGRRMGTVVKVCSRANRAKRRDMTYNLKVSKQKMDILHALKKRK
jgi:hypothetical protein